MNYFEIFEIFENFEILKFFENFDISFVYCIGVIK